MDKDDFIKLFDYDHWANKETLNSIRSLKPGNGRSVELFSHIIEAQRLWHDRIYYLQSLTSVWNAWNLEEAEKQMNVYHDHWMKFVSQVNEARLGDVIHYRNTKGAEFNSTIKEILMHVIQHSGYHRGQIAAEIRKAGGQPAYTDYIQYCRTR